MPVSRIFKLQEFELQEELHELSEAGFILFGLPGVTAPQKKKSCFTITSLNVKLKME